MGEATAPWKVHEAVRVLIAITLEGRGDEISGYTSWACAVLRVTMKRYDRKRGYEPRSYWRMQTPNEVLAGFAKHSASKEFGYYEKAD